MMEHAKTTLVDMLPIQEHYYVLSNDVTYAQFGTGEKNGLLVFDSLSKATTFCETVGCGLPEFQPEKVDLELLCLLIETVGAVCVADGLNVCVGVLTNRH